MRFAEPLLDPIRQAVAANEDPVCRFGECVYRARSWNCERRVIIKDDIAIHPGIETKYKSRFIVTNLNGSAKRIY